MLERIACRQAGGHALTQARTHARNATSMARRFASTSQIDEKSVHIALVGGMNLSLQLCRSDSTDLEQLPPSLWRRCFGFAGCTHPHVNEHVIYTSTAERDDISIANKSQNNLHPQEQQRRQSREGGGLYFWSVMVLISWRSTRCANCVRACVLSCLYQSRQRRLWAF